MNKKKKLFIILISLILLFLILFILYSRKVSNNLETKISKNNKENKKEEVNKVKDNQTSDEIKSYKIELLQNESKEKSIDENKQNSESMENYDCEYTIFFDYGGEDILVESKKVKYNAKYGELPVAKKVGYTFDGWYTDLEYTNKVNENSINNIKEDHTLYAKYNINSYLITYDYNYLENNLYNSLDDKSYWNLSDFSIVFDDEIFMNSNVYKFLPNDENFALKYSENIDLEKGKTYTFSVYIKSNDEKQMLIGFEDDLMSINVSSTWKRYTKTFTAEEFTYDNFIFMLSDGFTWNENDEIQISDLQINEGTLNVLQESKTYGDTLGCLDTPEREGYNFDGWYTDLTFSEKIQSSTKVSAIDKTYYAKWEPKLYTLKLYSNNTNTYNMINEYTQGYNTFIDLDIPTASYKISYNLNNTLAQNTKNEQIVDRKFIGISDEEGNFLLDNRFVFDKDTTLIVNYEDTVSVKLDYIKKENYMCSWNTKSDGTGDDYNSESIITISSDITLYANCKYNPKFIRPIVYGCITSNYGYRIHPIYGTSKFHSGIDMSGSKDIYPVANGTVVKTGYNSSMGNYIIIYHNIENQNYTSAYYHLEDIYVNVGDIITRDSIIGKMGTTGLSTGVHLHLTMYKGYLYDESSTMIDPNDYISFPSNTYEYWYDRLSKY